MKDASMSLILIQKKRLGFRLCEAQTIVYLLMLLSKKDRIILAVLEINNHSGA
jgi:hypothetical protein